MRFAAARGELMGSLPAGGAMAAVFASAERVAAALEEANGEAEVPGLGMAADNGTHQVVSGPAEQVEALAAKLAADGVRAERLNTSHAFHSGLMEPVLAGLEEALAGVSVKPPEVAVVSNVTGRVMASGEVQDGAYWRRHAREPVAFAEGVRALAGLGVEAVVEIGPGPVLGPLVASAWPADGAERLPPAVVSSQRRGRSGLTAFAEAVARAYEAGTPIEFAGLFAGESRQRVSVPTYPFQRRRYWVDERRRRSGAGGHPLLGVRRDSAGGETTFETDLFATDPAWLADHRVFGRVVAPGALYGSLAVAAATSLVSHAGPVVVDDMRLRTPLVLPEAGEDGEPARGRTLQVTVSPDEQGTASIVRAFSREMQEEAWTLHAEARAATDAGISEVGERFDPKTLMARIPERGVAAVYKQFGEAEIAFGPAFRGIESLWQTTGEAVGEVHSQVEIRHGSLYAHPTLLDACFQVAAAAAVQDVAQATLTYLPIGWDRLWLRQLLPERVVCHARVRESGSGSGSFEGQGPMPVNAGGREVAEAVVVDLLLYDDSGNELGGVNGFALKRASRAALLAAAESLSGLIYEVTWHRRPRAERTGSAGFLEDPATIAKQSRSFLEHLAEESSGRVADDVFVATLERLSQAYALSALERLGWQREPGTKVDSESMRKGLKVAVSHERLLRHLFGMLAQARVLVPARAGWTVAAASSGHFPSLPPEDLDEQAARLAEQYPAARIEMALLKRCGAALPDVLAGRQDPLELLFGNVPGATQLYRDAPTMRAANRILGEAVGAAAGGLPDGRRLRVLEVGAGTGSAASAVLAALPEERCDYVFTDVSEGFFADADALLKRSRASISYRVLDIERDPAGQGFDPHSYDLVIAANVLHATRDIRAALAHCQSLLAASGQLVALEGLRPQGWLDLTFGLLAGWWRFADEYRSSHTLVDEPVWRRALADAGFGEVAFIEAGHAVDGGPAQSVIVARGPGEVRDSPGTWVLAADRGQVACQLAERLAEHGQMVVLAGDRSADDEALQEIPGIVPAHVEPTRREAWRSLLESLPSDAGLQGVVYLGAVDGGGASVSATDLMEDAAQASAGALALVQGLLDADAQPSKGVWFVTRGAQVVDRETDGELAGSTVWGLGKTVAIESPQLRPRMIDLDASGVAPLERLVGELLHPDNETHVAYRSEARHVARLVPAQPGGSRERLAFGPGLVLARDRERGLTMQPDPAASARSLGPGEIRIAVAAAGVDAQDIRGSSGNLEFGIPVRGDVCGRVVGIGSEESGVTVGDRVVGFATSGIGTEALLAADLTVPVPPGISSAGAATIPTEYVTAALAVEVAELKAGERVLVHIGSDVSGQAVIQLARLAGAEVYATSDRSVQTDRLGLGAGRVVGREEPAWEHAVVEATGGNGIDVIVNGLTDLAGSESGLSCLRAGGRFVDVAERDSQSAEELALARPDVLFHVVALDRLVIDEPGHIGALLRGVMARLRAGELDPDGCETWRLDDYGAEGFRGGPHGGRVVLTLPSVAPGTLRPDRTYLVTGGLGGVGLEVAGWLARRGAGTIVLNGRRGPDAAAETKIRILRQRGTQVHVELADMANPDAIDGLLGSIEARMPPLAGVFHSVGVLADASLANQDRERFERVMRPKMIGAWHMHRATVSLDLDLFVLFSSLTGVLGNAGQANHAAANAFLDQLALHRRSLGLAGQSIAWGPWSGLGEAEQQRGRIEARLEAGGISWIAPSQGLRALEWLLERNVVLSVVGAVDWTTFAANVQGLPPLLEAVLSADSARIRKPAASTGGLPERLRLAMPSEREALLVAFLQQELQALMRLPSPPEPTVGFFDLGMDSLMAVELRNRLNRALSGEYVASSTVVFDYPDTAGLARHVAAELGMLADSLEPSKQHSAGRQEDDRIAIVGMACRFPGASSLEAFWQKLESGMDEVTLGRPEAGGSSDPMRGHSEEVTAPQWGAYLERIDHFDAEFFRIAPVEARLMDPQQRLLLETSWEALENAGVAPGKLRGSRTGVFMGIFTNDYRDLIARVGEDVMNLYAATGNSGSTAIGRVAFALGLEGPAMAVDTACSSSLVAVHQAVAGLQRGEADLALAGGVNAILSSLPTEAFTRAGMLASDGRCKTFDASADGYVRGEGCGVVVLKRLSDAVADGDRIWGVVRGTAVNQDGASAGLTVPNGPAQERVIEESLSRAGVLPSEVDYLEAHGTGTELGDPIEVQAAAAVYGQSREPGHPLLIGSVKTNIGHLEAAAGVAGLIKVVLSMTRGVIPRHLHLSEPNPRVDWDRLPVRVTTQAQPWPLNAGRPMLAGVSSFGLSGTNAHILVEGYAAPTGDDTGPRAAVDAGAGSAAPVRVGAPAVDGRMLSRRVRLLPLSGKSAVALTALAGRYLSWLEGHSVAPGRSRESADGVGDARPTPDLADMVWTASVGRSHFERRAGLVFRDVGELQRELALLADTGRMPRARERSRVAFVFTGQGSQWVGMGKDLYETEPVVRATLQQCDRVVQELRGASLLKVMFGGPGAEGDLDDTAWTQPALYALECALAKLWASIGIQPVAVLGHSVGELAAAHVAGAFGLEDGLRLAAARGQLMAQLPTAGPSAGAMAAVFAPAERIRAEVEDVNGQIDGARLGVATDNGAHRVVSGPADAVAALAARMQAEGFRVERLNTRHAFHSGLMDPLLEDLEAIATETPTLPPEVPLITNLTGRALRAGESLDGAYWRRQARETVAFAPGVETLAEMDVDVVIEIGPRPVLGPMLKLAWPTGAGGGSANSGSTEPLVVASQLSGSRRVAPSISSTTDSIGASEFAEAVSSVYEAGLTIMFEGLFAGEARRRVDLPTYPFQHQRYWIDPPKRARASDGHPLLGIRHDSPRGQVSFETELFASDPAWVCDRQVFGRVVAPEASVGAFAAEAASLVSGALPVSVDGLKLQVPLSLAGAAGGGSPTAEGRRLQVVLGQAGRNSSRTIEIFSKGENEQAWILHAEGVVSNAPIGADAEVPDDVVDRRTEVAAVDGRDWYGSLSDIGIEHGPALRGVEAVWSFAGQAIAEVKLPDDVEPVDLLAHPAQLDGCVAALAAACGAWNGERATYLPVGWERLWLAGPLPRRMICRARVRKQGPETPADSGEHGSAGTETLPVVRIGDVWLFDADHALVGALRGLEVVRTTSSALLGSVADVGENLYEVTWQACASPAGMLSAGFLGGPRAVAAHVGSFWDHLAAEGVDGEGFRDLLDSLEHLSHAYALAALDRLGWKRQPGSAVRPDRLRPRLKVLADREPLFNRLFGMLAEAGVLEAVEAGGGPRTSFAMAGTAIVDSSLEDPAGLAKSLAERLPYGSTEFGLLERCGEALADVLRGRADPRSVVFGHGGPSGAVHFRDAPSMRAAGRMLTKAVEGLMGELPEGRTLRVLEIGTGNWPVTDSVLPALPEERYDYTYGDSTSVFFAQHAARFRGNAALIEYRLLDIEADPVPQGFEAHGYDMVIAANALTATRDLAEVLAHCRALLSPSGLLLAWEGFRAQGWLDLTFGLLEDWWRFADGYRPNHPLATKEAWRRALADAGFEDVAVVIAGDTGDGEGAVQGLIAARGPTEVVEPAGVWVLAADDGTAAEQLAAQLVARNQTVVLASARVSPDDGMGETAGIVRMAVDSVSRQSWKTALGKLPQSVPLHGVVHLAAADGCPPSPGGLAADTTRVVRGAVALVQGLSDADLVPSTGLWFVTRGCQQVGAEPCSGLVGAMLWGLGTTVALELPGLQPRMIDLDPGESAVPDGMVDELVHADREVHVAYRRSGRHVARLERSGEREGRFLLPAEPSWRLEWEAADLPQSLRAVAAPPPAPREGEIRVAVTATGWDAGVDWNAIAGPDPDARPPGGFCGRVIAAGPAVKGIAVGDRVAGRSRAALGSEVLAEAERVALVPASLSDIVASTLPLAPLVAALAVDLAELPAGAKFLVNAVDRGVGLAAVQLASAAGAEVIAVASGHGRERLRSLGAVHVLDSLDVDWAGDVLAVTQGGVDCALVDLPAAKLIDPGLGWLKRGGRIVVANLGKARSLEEFEAERPDLIIRSLDVDSLSDREPARLRAALSGLVTQASTGDLEPLKCAVWPVSEIWEAMESTRSGRRVEQVALRLPPMASGKLDPHGTYLITGGIDESARELVAWLVDRGAGSLVLNGVRKPDNEFENELKMLRERGVSIRVDVSDISEAGVARRILEQIDRSGRPLAGVIHSVGAESEGLLANQDWDHFGHALWPKALGAWHLHEATLDRDLDLFVLRSGASSVLGSPGRSNEATANAFLNGLARHRKALGLAGQALAWGPWAAEAKEVAGVGPITPEQGVRGLDRVVRQGVAVSALLPVDWSEFGNRATGIAPLLDLVRTPVAKGSTLASRDDFVRRLRQAAAEDRQALLESFLQEDLQSVLRLPSPPEPGVGFFDLGMDSLTAVELSNRLRRAFAGEVEISNTAVFDFPSAADLARHLAGALGTSIGEAQSTDQTEKPSVEDERERIRGLAEDEFLAELRAALDKKR